MGQMEVVVLSCAQQPTIEPIDLMMPVIGLRWSVFRHTHALVMHGYQSGGVEMSWVGKVSVHSLGERRLFEIEEIRALKQRSSAAYTALDVVELGKLASEWIAESGGEKNPLRFWGHSHLPSIGTNPSPRDDNQMNVFVRGEHTPPFFIRGIFCGMQSAVSPVWSNPQSVDKGMPLQVDFTLYDYARGVKIRHVPWGLVDREGRAGLIERINRASSNGEASGVAVSKRGHPK